MPDDLNDLLALRSPVAGRPLLGVTLLAVEDSRFASEALRLLCLRSGARLRRADTLRAARRHLATYRPAAVVIDVGLPDGSGLDLVAELAASQPRIPAIVAISGDPAAEAAAIAAGADAFLAKPLESLRAFQDRIGAILVAHGHRAGPPSAGDIRIFPDRLALRDDLAQAAQGLAAGGDAPGIAYLARFVSGVARAARDAPLESAAVRLASDATDARRAELRGLVEQRLGAGSSF